MSDNVYYSGQGEVYSHARASSGKAGPGRWFGNVPSLELVPGSEEFRHRESFTGDREEDFILQLSRSIGVNFTLEMFSTANLAEILYGVPLKIAAATVTKEPLVGANDVFDVGAVYPLSKQQVNTVVLNTGTTATPPALVQDVDYQLMPAHGAIKFLKSSTALSLPITASYKCAASTNIGLFTQPAPERTIRFQGLNTADSQSPVLVEIYRVRINPLGNLPLINEQLGQMQVTATALADLTKPKDPLLGRLGRIVNIGDVGST